MPYRVDIRFPGPETWERLVELGAIDIDDSARDSMAAIMPDSLATQKVTAAFEGQIRVSAAVGRDDDSVWILRPRSLAVAGHTLTLSDSPAFGTGLHPTTALCLDTLADELAIHPPESVLDVGTGSGVLALAALLRGVPRAVGIDTDPSAPSVAAANARHHGLDTRLQVICGGPEALSGTWPLVLANILAAPLIEMAPTLVRRVGHAGRLVLSGIPDAVAHEVEQTYRHRGLHAMSATSRLGWTALVMRASW